MHHVLACLKNTVDKRINESVRVGPLVHVDVQPGLDGHGRIEGRLLVVPAALLADRARVGAPLLVLDVGRLHDAAVHAQHAQVHRDVELVEHGVLVRVDLLHPLLDLLLAEGRVHGRVLDHVLFLLVGEVLLLAHLGRAELDGYVRFLVDVDADAGKLRVPSSLEPREYVQGI